MGNGVHNEKFDYYRSVLEYARDMDLFLIMYKNSYDKEQLHELEVLARRVSKLQLPERLNDTMIINEDTIIKYFLDSLRVLRSPLISSYYKEKTENTPIISYFSLIVFHCFCAIWLAVGKEECYQRQL